MRNGTKALIAAGTGAVIISSGVLLKYQDNKINDLRDQLYLKQQNEQRAQDFYESTLNMKTIQSKFNVMKEYSVQKNCKINMDHKYNYSSDGAMGLKHKIELTGHGQLQYDINVRFDTAIIKVSDKNIKIQIEKPYVDDSSIKLIENTLVMEDQYFNFWANKTDAARAQKLYIDSFVDSGHKNILDLYKLKEKQNYINKVAISEVHALIRTLDLVGNCNVTVEIIE